MGSSSASHSTPRRLGRRPVLDGLRGIAILLVMLTHTRLVPNGYIGVDLFFALSGFLITTLLYEEWGKTGAISLRRFYERRARRLMPALMIVLGASAVINFASYRLTGWSLEAKALTTFLFINNWVAGLGHGQALGGLNPTWSLAQEEQFYLVWPLALMLMLRMRLTPGAVILILALAITALLWAAPRVAASVNGYDLYYSPVDRFAELLLGCLAAIAWRYRALPSPPRLLGHLSTKAARLANACAGPVRTACCWGLVTLFCLLLLDTTLQTRTVYLWACLLAVLIIVNLLALARSLPARLISCSPLRGLGRISYALYLFHLPVYNLLRHYFPGASVDQIAFGTFAISIPAAALSWRLVESRVLSGAPAQAQRAGANAARSQPRARIGGGVMAGARSRSPTPGAAR